MHLCISDFFLTLSSSPPQAESNDKRHFGRQFGAYLFYIVFSFPSHTTFSNRGRATTFAILYQGSSRVVAGKKGSGVDGE
jgi:hypothetical protein